MSVKPHTGPLKDYFKVFGPAVVLTLAAFAVAYRFVDPAPPTTITIAAGGTSGAYFLFGQRYARILERDGITLQVRHTAGSLENIALLDDPGSGIDIAFVQGGTGDPQTSPSLISLASLYFEPVWVFHHRSLTPQSLSDLRGKRIAIGPKGSGTRPVALELLHDNAVTEQTAELLPLGGQEGADALLSRNVDALFTVASPQSELVSMLLSQPGISVMHFERAMSYSRVHRYLAPVTLLAGVINFHDNIPPRDVELLAATANLVVRDSFHPALIDLILQAASEVHGEGGLFELPNQFPSRSNVDFPLSEDAKRFFESGPPFLQRYLPFWAATLVDRLLVMLLPLLALLIPLMRVMPPVYRWRIRSRIYRWYRELLAVDPGTSAVSARENVEERSRELDRIEGELLKLSVPLSYADELYDLRMHIQLIREHLGNALNRIEQRDIEAQRNE